MRSILALATAVAASMQGYQAPSQYARQRVARSAAPLVTEKITYTTVGAYGAQRQVRVRNAQLSMGWGDPPVWSDAVVKSNDEAGDGLRAIALEVSPETLEAHRIGGQYVQLTLGEEKPGFYAIASPPVVGPTEGKAFEFLIKENEGNAYLTSLAAGAAVKCSEVSGGGYAVGKAFNGEDGAVDSEYDGFACMNQLFVAGGSGIAPIRSTIESGVALDLPKPATLYYGVQDASVMAYADKFDLWRSEFNVDVKPCHSRPRRAAPSAATSSVHGGRRHRRAAEHGRLRLRAQDMFVAVKELLTKAGVFESRVLSNF
ncbi:oxidoreductase [Aureococcus anophagefferens]|nr:oxidoreductase [Aureococcus anophagefferens]